VALPPGATRRAIWRAGLAAPIVGRIARPVLAGAIAAGLGMVQFLPSTELAAQSVRSSISWEEAGEFALQPVGLLGLVLPRVFGANPTSYWVPWQSTETWGYLGVVALLLAGLALALRRDRITAFAALLGALTLLLSLGPFTAFFALLHGLIPGFDRFRGAGRFLLELGLATGLLAALGLDRLTRDFRFGILDLGFESGIRDQGSGNGGPGFGGREPFKDTGTTQTALQNPKSKIQNPVGLVGADGADRGAGAVHRAAVQCAVPQRGLDGAGGAGAE
jgi:hypothetical protein